MGILFRDSQTIKYVTIGKRTVKDGEAVAIFNIRGEHRQVIGPRLVRLFCSTIRFLDRKVAGPTEYLQIIHKNGRVEHIRGPLAMFCNPVFHQSIVVRKATVLASPQECLVVYHQKKPEIVSGIVMKDQTPAARQLRKGADTVPVGESKIQDEGEVEKMSCSAGIVEADEGAASYGDEVHRRVVTGPAIFVPRVGEWTHKFNWRKFAPGKQKPFEVLSTGTKRLELSVPMRTAESVAITAKLSIQYNIEDVNLVLKACEDPITALESFLAADLAEIGTLLRNDSLLTPEARNQITIQLGDIASYSKLMAGTKTMGLSVTGLCLQDLAASEELQKQYDAATRNKAKLAADRAAAELKQEMVDLDLENQKRRMESEQAIATESLAHTLRLEAERRKQELQHKREAHTHRLLIESERHRQEFEQANAANEQVLQFLGALKDNGVDLTKYLVSFSGQQATVGHLRKAAPLATLGKSIAPVDNASDALIATTNV